MAGNSNEPSEKTIAELKEKLGLYANETPKNPLFQGDWGTSINFFVFIPSLLLLLVGAFLLVRFFKRRNNTG